MTITIADLQARISAVGVQETAQQIKAVGDQAAITARALSLMAEQASKSGTFAGSGVQDILRIFQQGNVQPTAAAMAQAAQEMQKTAAAAAQAAPQTQALARAASDHATAARNGTQAAQSVADGWKMSESSVVRFGTALVGINLGISLVAGAARLIHEAVIGTAEALTDWERSLVQVRAMYGEIAPQVVALSQSQAQMPGVISSQQELIQANMAAGFLTTRYGVSPALTGALTTQGARLGGTLLLPEEQRRALQDALVQYAQTGGGAGQLQAATGQPFDPLTLARRLGFSSEAALQGLTPQQQAAARTQLGVATVARANIQGGQEQRGLLDVQRDLQHNLEQAQANLQNNLENLRAPEPPAIAGQSDLARATNFPLLGPAGERQQAQDIQRAQQAQDDFVQQQQAYAKAVEDAQKALDDNSAALADNQTQLQSANEALAKMGIEAGSASARLLSFTGSLEDTLSIARGDVAAQAQSAVAARGRSAIPSIGTPTAEINFQATNTAYQDAYQNFVALQAQAQGDNAIRDQLQRQTQLAGPGLENTRAAAQRALDQAARVQPVQQQMGEAQKAQAQIDLAAAERQAQLDQISLTQRERYVQMMQQTVELRLQDNSLQQEAIRVSADLIRSEQAALPSERTASAAQYQQNLAQALAQQRMGRLLQGQDVSNLPSLDQLINMRYQGQLAGAENAPALVQGQRGIEVQQQNITAVSLQDALVQSNIHLAELEVDAQNLRDIPKQTQLNLEQIQLSRDSIGVQTEMREYLKLIAWYMTQQPPSAAGQVADAADRAVLYRMSPAAPLAPPDVPGNRRGP